MRFGIDLEGLFNVRHGVEPGQLHLILGAILVGAVIIGLCVLLRRK